MQPRANGRRPEPILGGLRNWPHVLEVVYTLTLRLLLPFKARLRRDGRVERLLAVAERASKGIIFGCRMCGQCVLHSTGMTCPMTCPKNLRNGPCGGVRQNGNCEILWDSRCVWVEAWRRSGEMPAYGHEILQIQPLLDWRLQGSSAWVNELAEASPKPDAW